MFQSLFDLLNTYVFSGAALPGTYYELVCILAATFGNLAMISLPFVAVWKIVQFVVRGY